MFTGQTKPKLWDVLYCSTPAQEDGPGEVFLQREEGSAHQREQEVTLHQQPAVVGKDEVVAEHQHNLTSHLQKSMLGETNSFQWLEILSFLFEIIAFHPYSGAVTVVELWICKKETVPDKDEDGS